MSDLMSFDEFVFHSVSSNFGNCPFNKFKTFNPSLSIANIGSLIPFQYAAYAAALNNLYRSLHALE